MDRKFCEWDVLRVLADQLAKRVAGRVIRRLQAMTITLSGDDSPLRTTWDEICVQLQYEQSYAWGDYDETVRALLQEEVRLLPPHERQTLWTGTDAAIDWRFEEPEDRDEFPVSDEPILDWLSEAYVYSTAEGWSNSRIRLYLERHG